MKPESSSPASLRHSGWQARSSADCADDLHLARIGAAVSMKVSDVFIEQNRLWVRLHEKGGKRHEMPCHHSLEEYLRAYIDAAGLGNLPKPPSSERLIGKPRP